MKHMVHTCVLVAARLSCFETSLTESGDDEQVRICFTDCVRRSRHSVFAELSLQ